MKGPVTDKLRRSDFFDHLSGRIYLSQYDALADLDPDATRAAETGARPTRSAATMAL